MKEVVTLLGYHGTINYFAELIVSQKEYKCNPRSDHWLGEGIYFFENDKAEAEWWAGNTKTKSQNKFTHDQLKKVVLINEIFVDREKLYDDITTTDQKKLEDFIKSNKPIIEKLKKDFNIEGISKNDEIEKAMNILRGNLIYTFCKMNDYKVAKAVFTKPQYLVNRTFPERQNLNFSNISNQICVYDTNNISFNNITKEVLE